MIQTNNFSTVIQSSLDLDQQCELNSQKRITWAWNIWFHFYFPDFKAFQQHFEESSKCILSYCNSLLHYTCFENLFIIYSSIFKIKTHLILHKWIDTRSVAVIRIWFISIALLQELKMKCQIWDEMALAVHNIFFPFVICNTRHVEEL